MFGFTRLLTAPNTFIKALQCNNVRFICRRKRFNVRTKRKDIIPENKFKYAPEIDTEEAKDVDSLMENEKGFVEMPNPYEREKKKCILCALNITPNYKNVKLLSQFRSSFTGRPYGRHITGLCKMQQELIEKEIIKAQNAGIMAYSLKEIEFLSDPKLFDPSKPIRPHPY